MRPTPSASSTRSTELPEQLDGRARASRRRSTLAALPAAGRHRQRSSCSAWAARGSPATCSRPSATDAAGPGHRAEAVPHARRSSARARSRSRCRTRATPRRRCRWRRGASDAGAQLVAVSRGGALAALAAEHGGGRTCRARPALMPARGARRAGRPAVRHAVPSGSAPRGARVARDGAGAARASPASSAGPRSRARRTRPASSRRKIGRTIPLVHGGGALGAVAAYALEVRRQREREGARVLERRTRSSTTTRSAAGASTAT